MDDSKYWDKRTSREGSYTHLPDYIIILLLVVFIFLTLYGFFVEPHGGNVRKRYPPDGLTTDWCFLALFKDKFHSHLVQIFGPKPSVPSVKKYAKEYPSTLFDGLVKIYKSQPETYHVERISPGNPGVYPYDLLINEVMELKDSYVIGAIPVQDFSQERPQQIPSRGSALFSLGLVCCVSFLLPIFNAITSLVIQRIKSKKTFSKSPLFSDALDEAVQYFKNNPIPESFSEDAKLIKEAMRIKSKRYRQTWDRFVHKLSVVVALFSVLCLRWGFGYHLFLSLFGVFAPYNVSVPTSEWRSILREVVEKERKENEEKENKQKEADLLKRNEDSGTEETQLEDDVTHSSMTISTVEVPATISFTIEEPVEEEPLKPTTQKVSSFLDGILVPSVPKAIATYCTALVLAPKYKDGPKRCMFYHAAALSALMSAVYSIHGKTILRVIDELVAPGCLVGESLEEFEGNSESSWLNSIAGGFDKLSQVENTKFGKVMTAFFTFVCTLPIILSKAYSAESHKEAWNQICRMFRTGGASLATIFQNLVLVQNNITSIEDIPSAAEFASKLFSRDNLEEEYIRCYEYLRKLRLGLLDVKKHESEEVLSRYRSLARKCSAVVSKGKPSAIEVQRAKEAGDMLNAMTLYLSKKGAKMPAYRQSFYSSASGIGKSTFARALSISQHKWIGLADSRNVCRYNLGANFQDATNQTTEILLDDQAQIVVSKRNELFAAAAFKLGEPGYVPIEKPDLSDKGVHFYCHSIATFIDNTAGRGMDQEVYCYEAAIRRLGDQYEVRLRDEYCNKMGGLKEGVSLSPWGEHLLFCPFEYEKDSNGEVARKNILKDESASDPLRREGWIDNVEFFAYSKERLLSHRARQREILYKSESSEDEELCTHCNVLPPSVCRCGQNFMDACEESDPEDALHIPGIEQESLREWLSVLTPSTPNIEGFISKVCFHIASLLIFRTYGKGRLAKVALILLRSRLPYAFFFTLFIITISFRWENDRLMSAILSSYFAFSSYILWKVRRLASRIKKYSLQDIVCMYNGNLQSMSGGYSWIVTDLELRKKAIMATLTLAALYAAKRIWSSIFSLMLDNSEEEEVTISSGKDPQYNKLFDCVSSFRKKFPGAKYLRVELPVAEGFSVEPSSIKLPEFEKVEEKKDPILNPWETPIRVSPGCRRPAETIHVEDMNRLCQANTFQISFTPELGPTIIQHIFMIDCWIGVTSAHAVTGLDGSFSSVIAEISVGERKRRFSLGNSNVLIHPHRDLAFICFSSPVFGSLKNLKLYLPTSFSEGNFSISRTVLLESGFSSETVLAKDKPTSYGSNKVDSNGVQLMATNDISYIVESSLIGSRKGYCGLPAFRTTSPRTILGIHAAGGDGKSVKYMVIVPLIASDFARAQEFFKLNCGYTPQLLHEQRVKFMSPKKPVMFTETVDPKHPLHFVPCEEGISRLIHYEGGAVSNYTPVTALKMNKDVVVAMDKLNLKPIVSRPKFKWRDSARVVLSKATQVLPVESEDLDRMIKARDLMWERCAHAVDKFKEKHPEYCRPLSVSEALNGFSITPAMKLSTASGTGGKKSEYVVGDHPYRTPTPELSVDIGSLIQMFSRGEDPRVVVQSSIKDEALKDGKLERYFYITPMPLHVLTVMYCRVLVEIMNMFPLIFYSAIGLNRVGPSWVDSMRAFKEERFDKNCVDTDYKDYDKSSNPLLRSCVHYLYEKMAERLGYSESDMVILRGILASLLVPTVNLGGAIVHLPLLWISGTLFTTHTNGFKQVLLNICDYLRFGKFAPEKWEEHLALITLGDDGCGSRSNEMVQSGWEPSHLVETCRRYGMTMTSADKDNVLRMKDMQNCEFLKSWPMYHTDLRMNVSVVGPKSYFKPYICYEIPEHGDMGAYYADIAHNVLMEAFFGGRRSFETMSRRLKDYHDSIDLPVPQILSRTYEEWLEEYTPPEPQEPLFEITERGQMLIDEYDAIEQSEYSLAYSGILYHEDPGEMEEVHCSDPCPEGEEVETQINEAGVTTTEVPDQDQTTMSSDTPIQRMALSAKTSFDKSLDRRYLIFQTDLVIGEGMVAPALINPYMIMLEQRNVREKLGYFAFMRASLVIDIEITVPPTMAGSFICAVLHCPDSMNTFLALEMGTGNICGLSQKQHLFLNIGDGTGSFTLKIPYIHPAPMLQPFSNAWEYMTKLALVPVVSLASSLEGNPTGTLKMFCRYTDLELTGATGYSQPGEPITEGEEISSAVKTVSQVVKAASSVPGLSSLSLPGEIIGKAGDLLHYAGFSKEESGEPMIPGLQKHFPNGNGAHNVVNLGLTKDQAVTPTGAGSGLPEDELTFERFTRSYSLIDKINVDTTSVGETRIAVYNVTPAIFVSTGVPFMQPASVAAPSLYFSHWCGGMEYKFVAICPLGTSGKIRVQYDPLTGAQESKDAYQDLSEETREHVILDIGERTQSEISVGYSSALPALYCAPVLNGTGTPGMISTGHSAVSSTGAAASGINYTRHWKELNLGSPLSHNGRIELYLHTKFQTGSGNSMPVRILVFARGAPDLAFYKYTGALHPDLKVANDFQVEAPFASALKRISPVCANSIGVVCEGALPAPPKESVSPTDPPTTLPPTPQPSPSPTTLMPTTKPTPEPTTLSPTPLPTVAPTTLSPTPLPTAVPTTLSPTPLPTPAPTTLMPTVKPTQAPTTLAPTKLPTPAPTKQPTPAPTTLKPTPVPTSKPTVELAPLRGAPGLILGVETPNAQLYWLDNDGVSKGEASWKVTGFAQFSINDAADAAPAEVGISCRLVSGTATLNGVPVPTTTDTLLFLPDPAQEPEFNFTIEGVEPFDVRIYSGSRRMNVEYGLISQPPPAEAGWTFPDAETTPHRVPAGYSSTWRDLGISTYPGYSSKMGTVTWKGRVELRAPGSSQSRVFDAGNGWGRAHIYNGDKEARCLDTNSFIYSTTTCWVGSNLILTHPSDPVRRRNLFSSLPFMEGEVAIAKTDEITNFHLGSDGCDPRVLPRILSGEMVASWRVLLKVPSLINDYVVPASGTDHFEVTVFGNPYIDGDSNVIARTPYGFLLGCFNGMRGGMLSTYHIHGTGAISVTATDPINIGSTDTAGIGSAIADSRCNPVVTVKFPCQRNVDFTWTIIESDNGSKKSLTISGWNGDVRVKEWRSVPEDFTMVNFRGCPRLSYNN